MASCKSCLAACLCGKCAGMGSGKANGCPVEPVAHEIPNVGGPMAPIRQLGQWGAAAAAWMGVDQANVELPTTRLLFCTALLVDLG